MDWLKQNQTKGPERRCFEPLKPNFHSKEKLYPYKKVNNNISITYIFKTNARLLKRFLKEEKPYRPQFHIVFFSFAPVLSLLYTEFKKNINVHAHNFANFLGSALNFLAPTLNCVVTQIRNSTLKGLMFSPSADRNHTHLKLFQYTYRALSLRA